MQEAKITISDTMLNDRQSATVRMALVAFYITLQKESCARVVGPVGREYLEHLDEIFVLINKEK